MTMTAVAICPWMSTRRDPATCSCVHLKIIELLAYALVLSGNHVFTSGAMGTNAATIRCAHDMHSHTPSIIWRSFCRLLWDGVLESVWLYTQVCWGARLKSDEIETIGGRDFPDRPSPADARVVAALIL